MLSEGFPRTRRNWEGWCIAFLQKDLNPAAACHEAVSCPPPWFQWGMEFSTTSSLGATVNYKTTQLQCDIDFSTTEWPITYFICHLVSLAWWCLVRTGTLGADTMLILLLLSAKWRLNTFGLVVFLLAKSWTWGKPSVWNVPRICFNQVW